MTWLQLAAETPTATTGGSAAGVVGIAIILILCMGGKNKRPPK